MLLLEMGCMPDWGDVWSTDLGGDRNGKEYGGQSCLRDPLTSF